MTPYSSNLITQLTIMITVGRDFTTRKKTEKTRRPVMYFRECHKIEYWWNQPMLCCMTLLLITVRPWDARFLGNGKTCVAQNLCNLSYLIRGRKNYQKIEQVKVFTAGLYFPDLSKCYFLQILTKICSKVPIFYFNRPKHPPW